MLKVMTVVGTRPELIKMSLVISTFDQYTKHILVHTGQNYDYELNKIFFDELKIRKPDYFLEAARKTACETIGAVISLTDAVLEKEMPHALLVYGDTNSCLSVIAAKRRKIPIFHMEAGNRCFDQRVPEEINRKIVDHLSDVNFVLTEHARRYLIQEGLPPQMIIKTGSHMQEVLRFYQKDIEASCALEKMSLEPKQYFLISAHREENVDSPEKLAQLVESLKALVLAYDYPLIVSVHPRTRLRLDDLGLNLHLEKIHFLKPFGFFDYIKLQKNAFCVISDSGTLSEEASLLNLPAVMIRESHERPEGADDGVFVLSGMSCESLLDAVRVVTALQEQKSSLCPSVADYEGGQVSSKILKVVMGYVDMIHRNTWKKIYND